MMINNLDTYTRCLTALGFISPFERETWVTIGMALKDEFGEAGREIWEPWSQQADNYEPRAAEAVWRSIKGGQVGIGTLFYLAQQNGYSPERIEPAIPQLTAFLHNAEQRAYERQQQEQERAKDYEKNAKALQRIWANSRPLDGTDAASRYLVNRSLNTPHSEALRSIERLPYYEDGKAIGHYPALLGAVTDHYGQLVSVHRTYLTERGTKAEVPSVKKLMRTAAPLRGASIKLHAPIQRHNGLCLGIAEGIETALAAYTLFGMPTWACVTAGGLTSLLPDERIDNIYIFADNDQSGIGQEAAQHAATRLTQRGFVVRVHTPKRVGSDWADVLANGGNDYE